ncbi:M48 family metallopeptidase [Aliikangiella sp. G2MR2-5]|uniref:M48 family metallopeptidase n=1 Tax=Aliikangiella sp. G2MR2-5 TaxID=2788943 RepID=UPI0018AB19C9|nr:M48 family metallopeptidase [Aliikangiella sp. G2MR2-5]
MTSRKNLQQTVKLCSKTIISTVLVSLMLSACTTNIAGRKQLTLVSERQAIEASKLAYTETIKPLADAGKVNNNPKLTKRVERITKKLIEQAILLRPETRGWNWQVKVIDDPEVVNAWCMAGGKMAIYTGLINKLNATDGEIAQVMGHEISHALANHSAERMSVAMANNMALQMLQKATDASGRTMTLAASAAQVALTLPNSRASESEADEVGIELAAKAGFHPKAAVTLWQKMAKQGGGQTFEFLSTHPSPQNRQKALEKLGQKVLPFYKAAKKKQVL